MGCLNQFPVVVVDPQGKDVEVPIDKPHKKRKKLKPLVVETPKKAKLLSSAMSAAKTTKVHPVLCFSCCRSVGFSPKPVTAL